MSKLTTSSDIGNFLASANKQSAVDNLKINIPLSGAGALILTAPAGSFAEGDRRQYFIESTGGGNLTLSAIALPSDSLISFPKTLQANQTYIAQIIYVNGSWGLSTLIGGYA